MVDEYPNGLRTIWNNNIITSSFRDIQRACLKDLKGIRLDWAPGVPGVPGAPGTLDPAGPKFHPGTRGRGPEFIEVRVVGDRPKKQHRRIMSNSSMIHCLGK